MPGIEAEATRIVRDLQAAHVALDRMAAGEVDRFVAALRRSQSYVYRRTAEIIPANPMGANLSMDARLAWYRENWASIETVAAKESGYARALSRYVEGYDRMAGQAERALAAGLPRTPGGLTRIPAKWIQFVKKRDYIWFDFLNQEAVAKLDQVVLWNVISGRSPAGLLQELKGTITGKYDWGTKKGLYEWHAGTYARTAHHRSVATWKSQKAEELGLEYRIYIGPIDAKTRDFCVELVGTVHNTQEIEQMDNGQTGNVLVDRGGWNCRHDWDPIDDKLAKQIRADEGIKDKVKEQAKKLPKPGSIKGPLKTRPAAPPKPTPGPRAFNPKDVEGWKPAKSIREAQQWALDHDLADNVGFSGLHLDAANEINRTTALLLRNFPESRARMKFLGSFTDHWEFQRRQAVSGSMKYWDKVEGPHLASRGHSAKDIAEFRQQAIMKFEREAGDDVAQRYLNYRTDALAYANRTDEYGGMAFNDDFYSPGKFADYIASSKKITLEHDWSRTGAYLPPGSWSVESTVAHEFGHILDFTGDLRNMQVFKNMDRIWGTLWSKEEYTRRFCGYAMDKFQEFFSTVLEEYSGTGWKLSAMRSGPREFLERMMKEFGVKLTG